MEELISKENEHYLIALSWNSMSPKPPNNKVMAEGRLKYFKRKLEKDSVMHQKYQEKMAEYVKNGHTRKVPQGSLAPALKT